MRGGEIAFIAICLSLCLSLWTSHAVERHPRLSATEASRSLHHKLTVLPHEDVTKDALYENVHALIHRVLRRGDVLWAESFRPALELIPFAEVDGAPRDVFEIDVDRDTQSLLVLRGSSGVALSAAFGHYLRYYAHCDVHWEHAGDVSLAALPRDMEKLPLPTTRQRVVFSSQHRYYQNSCTASYSFAFTSWSAWEREIDWMALNGVNLPLAPTGQEFVWRALWSRYGVSAAGLDEYFAGPAFLAWNRMANIRGFGGPLSDHWITAQAELQKKILKRYAELEITPVLPAFNGVVPAEMATLFPAANISRLTPSWNQFPDEFCCLSVLSSTDPLFTQIGAAFLTTQREVYGALALRTHMYACDTFTENSPASASQAYLSSSSRAVYESMRQVDPQAVWLMQGWPFLHDPVWTDEAIGFYLDGVPDDALVVLDLAAEDLPVWSRIVPHHKPFLWCMLHNYGGRRALYGDLGALRRDLSGAAAQAKQWLLGTGLSMEAIDQNPVVYEFMNELAFSLASPAEHDTLSLSEDTHRVMVSQRAERETDGVVAQWVRDYVDRRYNLHTTPSHIAALIQSAWATLLREYYSGESPVCHHYCHRESVFSQKPSWSLYQTNGVNPTPLVDAWLSLSQAREALSLLDQENESEKNARTTHAHNALDYDLVDVGRQVLANLFFDFFSLTKSAFYAQRHESFLSLSQKMLALLRDLDALLNTHKDYLLGRWIEDARAWGGEDAAETALLDYNARNQVTLWGDSGEISDYAMKQWGGLVGEYYLPRWALFFSFVEAALAQNSTNAMDTQRYEADVLQLGQRFCRDADSRFATEPAGDAVALSLSLQHKYGALYAPPSPPAYVKHEKTDVQGANLVSAPTWTRHVSQLRVLCDSDPACEGFTTAGWLKSDARHGRVALDGVDLYVKVGL